MEFAEEKPTSPLTFTGYDHDFLLLDGMRHETGLAIHEEQIIEPWGPQSPEDLSLKDLEPFFTSQPEVLIIGTGRRLVFPSMDLIKALQQRHIGFECMDSRAAVRTFNILLGEGRRVSIAVMLPGA